MAELKTIFVCSNCDAQFPKWSGRCLECGSWGTLQEQLNDAKENQKDALKKIKGAEVINLEKIKALSLERLKTGNQEIDRVLGGGLVSGALLLLSGEPGIGKSTLAAQIAIAVPGEVLYVSGEESALQLKSRLLRLQADFKKLKFVSEVNVEKIIAAASQVQPQIMIIDSIQTIYSSLFPAEAGSVVQIRAAAVKFLELAKSQNIIILLIGHVTKDGIAAGPKSLEHIVDTVLYLENETTNSYCLLRATKNRFGAVSELGVLEMTGAGFKEVNNPSAIFVALGRGALAGSVSSCVLEGSRPFLVDLQALVSKTVFGYPQRKSSGLDLNRLQVLSAVLSKRTKINLVNQDIIVNIVGGLKISDPSLDLAVCAAIASSYLNKSVSPQTVFLGEVGLGGEVRPVWRLEERLKEAARLGYQRAFVPDMEIKAPPASLELLKLRDIKDLEGVLLQKPEIPNL